MFQQDMTRRSFLRSVAAVSMTSLAVPSLIIPRSPLLQLTKEDKILSFYNIHTGETLNKCVFWSNGQFNQEALKLIHTLFRDYRTNQEHAIDPTLLSFLHKITSKLETTEPIQLVSGYRSPKTNGILRKKNRGIACKSQHLYGKAADIYIPGRTVKQIGKAAKSLGVGGVGRYSHFVHVDTGPVRSWGAV